MSEEILNYRIDNVSISDIVFSKEELRSKVYFESLDELARSIKAFGLLNPITVRRVGDKYELIAGFRRLKAAEIANLAVVPCRVVDSDDNKADMQKLHENLFREEVNPVDEGSFFKRLLVKNNWRIVDLAVQIHKSPSYVSKRIQLIDADPIIVDALQDGQINISIADELNKIDDPDTRKRLLYYTINSGATVDTVRAWRIQYEIDRDAGYMAAEKKDAPAGPPADPQGNGINKLNEDAGPRRTIQERVIETRPCYSCLAQVETKDIFVVYLCPDCKRALESALNPTPTTKEPPAPQN